MYEVKKSNLYLFLPALLLYHCIFHTYLRLLDFEIILNLPTILRVVTIEHSLSLNYEMLA